MHRSIRTIVVGVGDLDDPDPVLASAVRLAERIGATLHAVHAYEIPRLIWDAFLEVGAEQGQIQNEVATANDDALAAEMRRVAPGIKVHSHALRESPGQAIDRVAREVGADLIVIGATRRGALARQILGTTAQRVLRQAGAPVLVARGEVPERPQRVLLTTDLSELSAEAQEVGLDVVEAISMGEPAEVEALLVIGLPLGLPPRLATDDLVGRGTQALQAFLESRRPRPWAVQDRARIGVPAPEILEEAVEWSADLVILGTHSRTGVSRFWLGSVAEAVLRDLRCSALVIPVGTVE